MKKSISFVPKIQAADMVEPLEEHKQIALKRLQRMEENPESCLTWEDIECKIKDN